MQNNENFSSNLEGLINFLENMIKEVNFSMPSVEINRW